MLSDIIKQADHETAQMEKSKAEGKEKTAHTAGISATVYFTIGNRKDY